MEWDGKIQAASLTCQVSGRRIRPGECFWSALSAQLDGTFHRHDFCTDVWSSTDRTPFISWWRQYAPSADTHHKRVRLDAGVLRRLFVDLKDIPRRPEQCLCYVVALCLVRARCFTLHARPHGANAAELVLEDRHDHSKWRLRDPHMDDFDIIRVQRILHDIISIGPIEDTG